MKLAYAQTTPEVDQIFAEIRAQGGEEALQYVSSIPLDKFCPRDFHGPRFGHVSSNIAESNNSWLAGVREMFAVAFLDSLW